MLINYTKNSGLGCILQKVLRSYADGERTDVLVENLKMHLSLNNLKTMDDPERGEADPWWDYWEELTF